MNNEILTSKRMIFLMCMYLFGSTAILVFGTAVKQDTWIALLLAFVFVMPIVFLYGRIVKLFPGKDIYDIFQALFGKFFGSILSIVFIWYCIHLGALVLKNNSQFVVALQMPETHEIALMIIIIPVIMYIVKKGVVCLGKWATIIFSLSFVVMIFTTVLSFKNMDLQNMLPIMEHSLKEISFSALNMSSFPFAEIVLFLTFASSFKKSESPYKLYIIAFAIVTVMLVIILVRNVLVLGINMNAHELYPSYSLAKVININESLSRFESTISLSFVLSGIGKICVCVLAASKGISKLVKVDDYKALVIPSSVLVLALCTTVYGSATQMFDFLKYYGIYAMPFQIAIPLLIWIVAEIKMHKIKKLKTSEL